MHERETEELARREVRCVTSDTLDVMPAKNPRVNVVLERPLYDALGRLARREGASLSAKARDLLRDALETQEDLALARIAEERERTLDRSTALTHDEVWRGRRVNKR
jgi:transcriptional antiterminator Rof (Rho-off)